jgi:predicted tellurium resistance membrane protein TerC
VVSIPLVVLGAQIIMKLIERLPILILAGGALLGYLAGELVITDPALAGWVAARGTWLHWAGPIAGILLVVLVAKTIEARRRARRTQASGSSS